MLAQSKWICGFPMPGKGCAIKYSSILWPHQLSLFCIGKKRKIFRKNQNLGNVAKKNPQSWAKNIDKLGQRYLATPEQAGAGVLAKQVGWRAWTDRQGGRQVRSSRSLCETGQACPCHGTDLSSCPVQPGRVSLNECWALAISLLPPFHAPRCFPEVTSSPSFIWVGTEPRGEMSLPLKMRSQRTAVEEKNQTFWFEVREGWWSDASWQTGPHPELTQLTPWQGGLVHGWGRLFTSWAVFSLLFPFGATCSLLGFLPDRQGFLWDDSFF